MMYTKIAILSDTHSLLRPEVEKVLRGCDRILHAGDIASKETYDKIGDIAPTVFVRGNADKAWAEEIPLSRQTDQYEQLPEYLDPRTYAGFRIKI